MLEIQQSVSEFTSMPKGLTTYFMGSPKSGKTTASSSWSTKGNKGVLILDSDLGSDFIEGGARFIPFYGIDIPKRCVNIDEARNGSEPVYEVVPNNMRGHVYKTGEMAGEPCSIYCVGEVLNELYKNWDEYGVDTIVIDTIDKVYKWCEDKALKELKLSAMGEASFGSDWGKAREYFIEIIEDFQRLCKSKGASLVLTSHTKPMIIVDGSTQLVPELPRGAAARITALSDIIGYTKIDKESKDGQPLIDFNNYDERFIGSRIRALHGKVLPFDFKEIEKEVVNYYKKTNKKEKTNGV